MIIRWLVVGFVIWGIIAAAFRFVTPEIFPWLFMVLPLAMFALTYGLVKLLKVEPNDRAEAAAIFAVPGLLIGIYMINSFQIVFPELDASLSTNFAAVMFTCYAAVSVAGITSSRLERSES